MKTIAEYELINHGFQFEDYWNGCSKCEFTHVYTGNGMSAFEAFEDLLEQLAEIDIDVIELEKEYSGIMSKQQSEPRYYYISIRFNLL